MKIIEIELEIACSSNHAQSLQLSPRKVCPRDPFLWKHFLIRKIIQLLVMEEDANFGKQLNAIEEVVFFVYSRFQFPLLPCSPGIKLTYLLVVPTFDLMTCY